MATCRVVWEYREGDGEVVTMRWERMAACEAGGAFELLGRAYEVAQREISGVEFTEAVRAFLRGAMIQREDLVEVLEKTRNIKHETREEIENPKPEIRNPKR